MDQKHLASVSFNVVADVNHGETVYVVGNHPALGGGDVSKGVALYSSQTSWPEWFSKTPIKLKRSEPVAYRLALFSGGDFVRWGSMVENFTPDASKVCVEDQLTTVSSQTSRSRETLADDQETRDDASPTTNSTLQASTTKSVRFDVNTKSSSANMYVSDIQYCVSKHRQNSKGHARKKRSPVSEKRRRRSLGVGETIELDDKDGVIVISKWLPLIIRQRGASKVASKSSTPAATAISPFEWDVEWEDESFSVVTEMANVLAPLSKNRRKKSPATAPATVRRCEASKRDHRRQRDATSTARSIRVQWVGMPRITLQDGSVVVAARTCLSPAERERITYKLSAIRCVPVWTDAACQRNHHLFCHEILRPVMHNVYDVYGELPTKLWHKSDHSTMYRGFTGLCNEFAQAVVSCHNRGDMLWIQGADLLYLPSVLARKVPNATVGLFVACPFPSSEIFRTLSMREDLLRGMLNADQLGFAQYAAARHFLACCRRIMGLSHSVDDTGAIVVEDHGRRVRITVSHPGLATSRLSPHVKRIMPFLASDERAYCLRDPSVLLRHQGDTASPKIGREKEEASLLDRVLRWMDVGQNVKEARTQRERQSLVLSLGRSDDELSGQELRIVSIKNLIETYPEIRGKVRFLDIDICPRGRSCFVDASVRSARQRRLRRMAAAVNSICPGTLEVIAAPNVPTATRVALYCLADVFLSTSVRDGVDFFPLEYAFSRRNTGGIVIGSEFSTYSRVLHGAIFVNPWRFEDLTRALFVATKMPLNERCSRAIASSLFVEQNPMHVWAVHVLKEIKRAKKISHNYNFTGVGLGHGYRVVAELEGFKKLEVKEVCSAWRRAKRRVLFLDFRGTIAPYALDETSGGAGRIANESVVLRDKCVVLPSAQMRKNLVTLASDPRTDVFILSGLESAFLDRAFEKNFGAVSLVAEHGFFYKRGVSRSPVGGVYQGARAAASSAWRMLLADFRIDLSWIAVVRNIMELYQQRTMGSRIEQKTSSLVWDHSNADADFAAIQASNMIVQMKPILRNFAVDILEGKGYVEVRQKGVNKGAAAMRLLEILSSTGRDVDFVLCLGDDSSDETMFRELRKRKSEETPCRNFLCTVGKKPSDAEYYVNDVDDVEALVNMMALRSAKSKASRSMSDIRQLRLGPTTDFPFSTSPRRSPARARPSSPGRTSPASKELHRPGTKERPAPYVAATAISRVASMPSFVGGAGGGGHAPLPATISDFFHDIEEEGGAGEGDGGGGLWM